MNLKGILMKVHSVGGIQKGNQARIIKFTTHSYKEKVFGLHKSRKKNEAEKKR